MGVVAGAATPFKPMKNNPGGQDNGRVLGAELFVQVMPAVAAAVFTSSFAVPANFAFEILSMRINVTTSAVAANRLVTVSCNVQAAPIAVLNSNNLQAASLGWQYNFQQACGFAGLVNTDVFVPLGRIIVPAGGNIVLGVGNAQAGDAIAGWALAGLAWPLE